jgi:creatinine amidohydrolase/Fe(II)-dependent formamide hydrolase-like protein
VYVQVVKSIVHSVMDSGFWRIVVIHGCGGHWVVPGALWDVKAEAAKADQSLVLRHFGVGDLWRPSRDSLFPGDSAVESGHAGVIETSLCLSGREELVRMDHHRPPKVGDLDRRYREQGEVFLFSEMSDTGALYDASTATAEIGSRIWIDIISRLGSLFADLAKSDSVDPHKHP